MCGIFGYTGAPTAAAALVFAGLKKLEYRGYDSWGIAVGARGTVHTARDIGKLGAAPWCAAGTASARKPIPRSPSTCWKKK